MSYSRPTLQDGDSSTDGELLFIWRRRQDMNQKEAAATGGFSVRAWVRMEKDEAAATGAVAHRRIKSIVELTGAERCVLYRRRANEHQWQTALQMGVSRVWINRIERGHEKPDALIAFWEC